MTKSKDLNYEVLFLRCIGIFAVVSGHMGFGNIKYFPYYSWHMPFFILLSGYFYKEQSNLKAYVIKQFKQLIIPCYLINIITGISVFYLQKKDIINFGAQLSFKNLFLELWVSGHQFGLNAATWFIPALFLVQIMYALIRTFIKIKNREIYIIILTLFLSLLSIYISNMGYHKELFLILVRTGFLLFFFAFGYFFNHFIEGKFKEGKFKINRFVFILFILGIQIILLNKFKNIIFSAAFCNDFNSFIFLPIITTLTATLLLFNIVKILPSTLTKNHIVKFVGLNTIAVLYGHQFCMFITDIFFYILKQKFNFSFLQNFNINAFKTGIWYFFRINNHIYLFIFVICFIIVPIVVYKILKKYINNIKQMCVVSLIGLIISCISINCIEYLTRFYLHTSTVISFSKSGNSSKIIYNGWNDAEENWTWSQTNANVKFFTKEKRDISLKIKYENPKISGKVKLFFNGAEIYIFEKYDEILTEKITLPLEYMNEKGKQILEFKSEINISPKELNLSEDNRKLGICVYEIELN